MSTRDVTVKLPLGGQFIGADGATWVLDQTFGQWYKSDPPTESIAKALAIKLAVSELEKLKAYPKDKWHRLGSAEGIVINLLIGLGCQEVVDAWEECS